MKKFLPLIILAAFGLGVPLGKKKAQKYQRLTYAHGLFYYGPTFSEPKEDGLGWTSLSGRIFPYTLTYPKKLSLVQFSNDPHDSVGIETSQNLILFVESISEPAKDFVKNYWQLYSGLSGLKYLKEFTSEQGIVGFEASYNKKSSDQSLDVFLSIENDPYHLIHLLKGDLEEEIFREIVARFELKNK